MFGLSDEFDFTGDLLRRQEIVDQDQSPKQLTDGYRVLVAEGDGRVGNSVRIEPQEIIVVRHHHSSRGEGELKLRTVESADQSRFAQVVTCDVAPAESGGDVARDVLVKMKPDGSCEDASFKRS